MREDHQKERPRSEVQTETGGMVKGLKPGNLQQENGGSELRGGAGAASSSVAKATSERRTSLSVRWLTRTETQ